MVTMMFNAKTRNSTFLVIVALMAIAPVVMAQLEELTVFEELTVGNRFGVGARAMGMGGAFCGVADDFTAVHWNPAGLAQQKRFELSGGLSHTQLNTDIDFFKEPTSASESTTRPNSLGIVYPIPAYQGGATVAFGVNRVQNFDALLKRQGRVLSHESDFSGLFVTDQKSNSGSIYAWSFGGAFDISPNISLGGSFAFLTGEYAHKLMLDAGDTPATPILGYDDTIERDYYGFSGKIGILAKLNKHVNFGATVTLPTTLEVDEYWTQENIDYLEDTTPYYDYGYTPSFDIRLPLEFAGGLSFHSGRLLLAADLQYADWTQTEYSRTPAEDVSNDGFDAFYRDTLQVRVGGEFLIPVINSKVRAGYLRDSLAFLFSADKKPDNDRDFLTLGFGTMIDKVLELNVAYLRGMWEQETDEDVSRKQTSNQVFFSVAYRY